MPVVAVDADERANAIKIRKGAAVTCRWVRIFIGESWLDAAYDEKTVCDVSSFLAMC